MLNTTTSAPQIPANAVTEEQAHRMLERMGLTGELVAGAFYRLRSRSVTLLDAGTWSYRFTRLAEDIYVIAQEPTTRRLRTS